MKRDTTKTKKTARKTEALAEQEAIISAPLSAAQSLEEMALAVVKASPGIPKRVAIEALERQRGIAGLSPEIVQQLVPNFRAIRNARAPRLAQIVGQHLLTSELRRVVKTHGHVEVVNQAEQIAAQVSRYPRLPADLYDEITAIPFFRGSDPLAKKDLPNMWKIVSKGPAPTVENAVIM